MLVMSVLLEGISLLFAAFVGLVALCLAAYVLYWVVIFASFGLPTLIGLAGCAALWQSGHDNLGVVFFLASFALYPRWAPIFGRFADWLTSFTRGGMSSSDGSTLWDYRY